MSRAQTQLAAIWTRASPRLEQPCERPDTRQHTSADAGDESSEGESNQET